GRALLERLIADAEAGGFRQMIAVIGDSANAGSIELHRAAGFRMVGTFDNVGFKFGRWLDSVLMQRPLGAGAMEMPEPAPGIARRPLRRSAIGRSRVAPGRARGRGARSDLSPRSRYRRLAGAPASDFFRSGTPELRRRGGTRRRPRGP